MHCQRSRFKQKVKKPEDEMLQAFLWRKKMRTIIVVIYVFLFLILGLPVLGIEWIIAKFDKHAADISQLRIVQWGLRCVSFWRGFI